MPQGLLPFINIGRYSCYIFLINFGKESRCDISCVFIEKKNSGKTEIGNIEQGTRNNEQGTRNNVRP